MTDDRNTDAPDARPDAGAEPAGHTAGQGGPDIPDIPDIPGRPIGRDELDPALITLPRPRTRIGPLLSISIIVFCIYIMLRMYPDLRFSLHDGPPHGAGSATALLAGDAAAPDRFVRVDAVPDRSYAVRVTASLADAGSRLAPAQGTGGKLWIMLGGNVWTAGIHYEEVYTGRLRRLDDLPFAETLRSHLAERPPAPRFVQPAAARTAIEAGAATVAEPAGDHIAVADDTPVRVYEAAGDQVRIEAIASERQPTAEAWAQALADIGMVPPGTRPVEEPEGVWVFAATVAGGAGAARARLEEAKLFSAAVTPVKAEHETTWGQLASRGNDLLIAGKPVPWSRLAWLSLSVTRPLPAGAWVLLTEEHPDTYWYVLPLFIVLGIFGLLFLWALVHTLRPGDEGAAPAATPAPPQQQSQQQQ